MTKKTQEIKRPAGWLTVSECREFVKAKFKRHWSNAHVYSLMDVGRLRFFKLGSIRILLEKDVTALIKTFKRPSPPEIGRAEKKN